MGLIYRGETNFQLKGAIPVKLPLLLTGQAQITCLVQCKQRQSTWNQAGFLEQFAFLPDSGMTTLRRVRVDFDDNQLIDLDMKPQSFLRFIPVKWLKLRTNISIFEISEPLSNFAIRINCGGNNYIDSFGNNWLADTCRVGGSSFSRSDVAFGTPDPVLFFTESYNFSYLIPIENAQYQIKLYFCDFDPLERVFSVSINGQVVLDSYSINGDVGLGVAVIKSFNISVDSGAIAITSTNISGQTSKINAIEIIRI